MEKYLWCPGCNKIERKDWFLQFNGCPFCKTKFTDLKVFNKVLESKTEEKV